MRIALTLVLGFWVVALSACSEPCIPPVVPAHPDPCDGGECVGGTYCAVDAGVSGCAPSKPLGVHCARDPECTADASCDAGVCVLRPAICPTALEIRPPRDTSDAPRGRVFSSKGLSFVVPGARPVIRALGNRAPMQCS